jgi:hypothetical protein
MFALPGVCGLVVFLYLRPLDVIPSLRGIPFLQVFLLMAVIGVLLDLRLGVLKMTTSPITKLVLLWAGWDIFVTLTHGPTILAPVLSNVITILVLYFVVANGIQTMKGLAKVSALLLVCILALTAVGIHQSIQPKQCLALDPRDVNESPPIPDGRECTRNDDCSGPDAPNPDAEYFCEKVGVFNIFSDGGRVRYTGTLKDPNEFGLTIILGVPMLHFFWSRKKHIITAALAIAGTVAIVYCMLQTASRGGMLIMGVVFLVAAARWAGWKGVALVLVFALPPIIVGPSGREDADESSMERAEAMFIGLSLVKSYPIRGIGMGQYGEHFHHTAHNAYVLTATEQGFPGGVIWTALEYLCAKTALRAYLRYRYDKRAETASQIGWVLFNSFAGMMLGVFFLSFAYNYVFWTYVGVTGAFYGAIRLHDPKFEVTLTQKEIVYICIAEAIGLLALFLYVKNKTGL